LKQNRLRLGLTIAAFASAIAVPFQSTGVPVTAPSPQAPSFSLAGPIDRVYAAKGDLNYSYNPFPARLNQQGSNVQTATFAVTYDAGFMANAAARTAFQAAIDLWSSIIATPVQIRVVAQFRDLGNPNILGQAGPSFVCGSAGGLANTFYANALADKLGGGDACAAGNEEIDADFNSTFANWDFGTTGVPVAGKYSFSTVVLHELGHGLGFFGSMTSSGGVGSFGRGASALPDIFDRFAINGSSQALLSFANPSAALGAQLVSNNIFFNGANAVGAGGMAKLESALNPFQPGSSYSHVDDALYTGTPNGLMTWALNTAEVYTDPGPIVRGVLKDEGWTIPVPIRRPDVDADGRADLTVFRPSTGQWYVRQSHNNYSLSDFLTFQWGVASDTPVAADFDGDGRMELAIWRPSTGQWFIRYSSTGYSSTFSAFQWGTAGDTPLVGDFDGDGKADLVIYRPANGTWFIKTSSTGYAGIASYQWGTGGDIPLPADFDGDAKTDLVVYRPSTGQWFVRFSSNGYSLAAFSAFGWGVSTDKPLPGDFDGDGKADLVIYRPSTGVWYLRLSSTGYSVAASKALAWGTSADLPLLADFDGDRISDLVVFRPSTGQWFVRYSSIGFSLSNTLTATWGTSGDVPLVPR
jgi:hypothetical protein